MTPTTQPRKRPAALVGATGSKAHHKKPRQGDDTEETNDQESAPTTATIQSNSEQHANRKRFLTVFQNTEYSNGISNSVLKEIFGEKDYLSLVPVINQLIGESRLNMSTNPVTQELHYTLVSTELAQQLCGLDVSAKMVYEVIERAGNMGIWTKDIRVQTNIQQQALNKIFKSLESRQLIKPVKSVAAKSKKLYMLYNLTPSKELTGGIWYSDLEFDHEFISELRNFILECVRRLNGGKGLTLGEILEKMEQAKVSRVQLSNTEVSQLVQTLIYDYLLEKGGETETAEAVYVVARRVSPMCEFKWWDALEPDFKFRDIRFEDGIVLRAHEPHYHT